MIDYTNDYLLDKKVKIFQPVNGYRASTDAVLLSSLLNVKHHNENILDVGSGTGAISLCLSHRLQSFTPFITGVEIQPELAELSNLSAQANCFNQTNFLNVDISQKKLPISPVSFDHVITNPPYSLADMPSPNPSKSQAHNFQHLDLNTWIKFCLKMLKPFGWFYMINRAEAISEILTSLHKKSGNIKIIPIYSKQGQEAKRVMIMAQKDSKAPTSILSPFIVHQDDSQYTPEAQKILRKGLSFFS